MREALEKLARHSAIFLIGLIFQRAAKLFLLPLYWNVFSPGELGLLGLFEAFIQVLVLAFSFALPSAYLKYRRVDVGESVSPEDLRGTTLVLSIGGLICLGAALAVFQTPLSWLFFKEEHPRLYSIAGLAVAASIAFLMVQGVLRAHGRAVMFVVLSSIQFLMLMAFNIYFVRFRGMGIEGVLWSSVIAWAAPSLVLVVMRFRHLKWRFDSAIAGRLIRFVVPLVPFSLLSYAVMISGRLFLRHFHGADEVGIFLSANWVALILMLVCVAPFQTSWGYLGLDYLRRDDSREIFSRAFTYLLALGLWTFLGVAFVGRAMVIWFAKKEYIPALPYIDVMMAGYLSLLFFYWANPILMREEMTGRIFLLALPAVLISIVGGWLIIPTAGIAGACGIFAIAQATQAAGTALYGKALLGFSLEKARVAKILAVFAVVYGGGRYLGSVFPDLRLLITLGEAVLFPCLLFASRLMTSGEIAWLRSLPRLVANMARQRT